MHKDFAGWNERKAQLDRLTIVQYFREREIWWTAIGHNIGSEENGKGVEFARPVLVLRKFNAAFFYGVPLSTTSKEGPYYYSCSTAGTASKVLLSHLRDYDAKRLLDKLDTLDTHHFAEIQKRLAQIISSSVF